MEEMTLHNRLVLDSTRLCNLLDQNLLVQSNAIVQKMEAMFEDILKTELKIEESKYFKPFKTVHIIRSLILSGRTGDAKAAAALLKNEILEARS